MCVSELLMMYTTATKVPCLSQSIAIMHSEGFIIHCLYLAICWARDGSCFRDGKFILIASDQFSTHSYWGSSRSQHNHKRRSLQFSIASALSRITDAFYKMPSLSYCSIRF